MNEISIDVSNPVVYENGGHFVAAQTWKHANRVIDNVEIIVGVYGTAYIRIGQKDFELKQGSVLIIPPMARHFGYKESEKCTSFYWAHFKKTDEVIFNNEKEMPENIAFPVYFDLPNPQRIFMLFKQLLHIGESLNYNKLSKNYMLTSILIETSTQDKSATQLYDSSASKIPKIKEWIRVHMDERISLSKIAFEFNYSKEHLSRLFKLSTATTINSYISSIRVAKAKELLLLTDFTISEISKMVGMEDDKYFYRLFKKHEKITPKEFRYSYNKVHLNIK